MAQRNITEEQVRVVLEVPEQTILNPDNTKIYQSRLVLGGQKCILRVIVVEEAQSQLVITAYHSTKIEKYWRQS
jgi:hypothetical protein